MFLYNSSSIPSSRAQEKENSIIDTQRLRLCKQNSLKNTPSILKPSLVFAQNTHSICPTLKPRLSSKNSLQSCSTLEEDVPTHLKKNEESFRDI